jgi:hypothetical protein
LSGVEALSLADFVSSGDRLDAREFIFEPLGVAVTLVSSFFSLPPLILCNSSDFVLTTEPGVRS